MTKLEELKAALDACDANAAYNAARNAAWVAYYKELEKQRDKA